MRKRTKESERLVGDYRRDLVERLFEEMFNSRFGELARKPDAKFLAAGAGGGASAPRRRRSRCSARVKDGGIAEGLRRSQIEARRVRQFGFTAAELDRAKKSMLSFYEHAYNERDKTESGSFAQEYLSIS